jgi:superfamily II DNA or RNA helicase
VSYQDFIAGKHRRASDCGIDVSDGEINPYAFDFQRAVIKWACKKGRAAIFADCGLGKSLMALDWMTHMIPRANVQRGILLTPVAVAPQMVAEAEKFGVPIPCKVVREQSECIDGINVTNYERLHKFDPDQFGAVVLDESSILKSFAGATKRADLE